VETLYVNAILEVDGARAAERLAAVWRSFGAPFTIEEARGNITFNVSLERLFSARFADRLGDATEAFRAAHNHVVDGMAAKTQAPRWLSGLRLEPAGVAGIFTQRLLTERP
jgi:hypothetical protein